ncbi:hypothetical protein HDV01_001778 [Terramyces sp. JEL0728]|nr:hypothetical protein HDV01_001778 [Terramyces sp. JEL0728]
MGPTSSIERIKEHNNRGVEQYKQLNAQAQELVIQAHELQKLYEQINISFSQLDQIEHSIAMHEKIVAEMEEYVNELK